MNDTQTSTLDPDLAPRKPLQPLYDQNPEWGIDMNYLMPFSVMLMILCVLLLMLCYLRHRMRQRRRLREELQLNLLLGTFHRQGIDAYGSPVIPERLHMMYPPTYDEAAMHHAETIQKSSMQDSGLPPPYTENMSQSQTNDLHQPEMLSPSYESSAHG
ncbi:uncharacterized protein [Watersipora subatra]|uniref:uncharacterized protein n=1 Tax=Watersipora subatra TaxID=2589382 RepID=UPI00355C5A02